MTNLLPCAEWADMLALKPADLSPDERAALQRHLATCPGCAATNSDYQMLMTRLRALPRPALPPLAPLAPEMIAAQDDEDQADSRYDSVNHHWPMPPGTEGARPPARLPRLWSRSWPQRLSLIAAVLLLTVLVGSLALLLHRSPPGPGGGTEEDFRLRPGWTQIVEYSGTGSQTITGQDIELPRLYGSADGCVGSGGLDIKLTGKSNPGLFGMSIDRCNSLPPPVVSPLTFSFSNTPVGKLDTIKITADAKTHWFFQFTQPAKQPTLRLGPEWVLEVGFGGDDNISFEGLNNVGATPYKTWGLVFTCFGTGKGYVQLTPDLGKINTPPCTGQPSLVKVHYPAATVLQAAQITVTGNILYDVVIFGCSDEQKCGG